MEKHPIISLFDVENIYEPKKGRTSKVSPHKTGTILMTMAIALPLTIFVL